MLARAKKVYLATSVLGILVISFVLFDGSQHVGHNGPIQIVTGKGHSQHRYTEDAIGHPQHRYTEDATGKTTLGTKEFTVNSNQGTTEKVIVNAKQRYVIDTPGCRIPDFDPFDPSLSRFVSHPGPIQCKSKPSLSYEHNSVLKIDWDVINSSYNSDIKYCTHQPIIRGQSDSKITFGAESKPFTKDVVVEHEFVRITCVNRTNDVVYVNYHSFVLSHEQLENESFSRLSKHIENSNPTEIMNVLMIGVDSVSRLNSIRQMPSTRKYLLDELDAIEMLGYTKVADNTFVNIIPLTTGLFVEELPWNSTMSRLPLDKYSYIWKNFSNSGYRTLYAEDDPGISIFNYLKAGFREPPVHHYYRTFSLALERDARMWSNGHHCVGDRLEADVVLNYVNNFVTTYRHKPYFAFTFLTRITHDYPNSAGRADDIYLKFLKQIDKDNLLNSTMMIFFSDHGSRHGNIRNTFVGKAEERLPMMFVVLPMWFKRKYPNIIGNLKINSRRLTTPFDIHATLLDVLYFNGKATHSVVTNRSISLFRKIPPNRTCKDAGILPHWCLCFQQQQIPVSSPVATKAAETIVSHINKDLSGVQSVCAVLSLHKVKDAVKLIGNTNRKEKARYGSRAFLLIGFQVTIVTNPGQGMFEATLYSDESNMKFSLAGSISRINKYGNQSSCIDNHRLHKYCYCMLGKKTTLRR